MGFLKRKIVVEGTNDSVELVSKAIQEHFLISVSLRINGIEHAFLDIPVLDVIFGYKRTLTGLLQEDVKVVATVRGHFFMRPEYTIHVGDQLVHHTKGNWGGF